MKTQRKPNVILINIDDMGYADLGCYGSTINSSPCIDKMAEDGMKFTDFYAAAPLCTPSRGGMLTGCYPKRIDFTNFKLYDFEKKGDSIGDVCVLLPGQPEGLNPEEKTIADIFKDGGYITKLIGKWHLGDQPAFSPLNYGFDSYLGLPYSNDMGLMTEKITGFKKYDLTLTPLPLMENDVVIEEQPDISYVTELYTNSAVSFIRENKDNPFFLYFAHTYVHHPLFVSERFKKESRNGLLGAAIAQIDWGVAALEYELKQLGIEDDTLIILVSDNGGCQCSSNAPLRGFKASAWEGGQRVNCIMKWPNKIKKGSISSQITTMMDFFPTFAEIAGVDVNDGVMRDGLSLMPILEKPDTEEFKRDVFYYYRLDELQAVRYNDYKYHLITDELYNLKDDIGEQNNIADKHRDLIEQMKSFAEKAREDMGDSYTGIEGKNCRPKGYVEDYEPICVEDKNKPYLISMYDVRWEED